MTWDEEVALHRQGLETGFAVFCRTPHNSLLWLTTVISAYVVTVKDDIREEILSAVERYDNARTITYQRSGRTYRSPRGWTRFCGSIEIDLIHPRVACICSRMKAGLLAELGIDVTTVRDDQRIVVLHEHAIIDHRGHASAEALKRDLRRAWPGDRRVHGKRLHSEGTVAQNLTNLAEYTGKFRFTYSIAWDDRKTRYLRSSAYEPEWAEYVRDLYRSIGIARLICANITAQGSRTRMHIERSLYRAKPASDEHFQLANTSDQSTDATHSNINANETIIKIRQSAENNGGTMKAIEISPYLDHQQIQTDAMRDLGTALGRIQPRLTSKELAVMYGDEERDLRIKQQYHDVAKTVAAINRLHAAAALDRAEAEHAREAGKRRMSARLDASGATQQGPLTDKILRKPSHSPGPAPGS